MKFADQLAEGGVCGLAKSLLDYLEDGPEEAQALRAIEQVLLQLVAHTREETRVELRVEGKLLAGALLTRAIELAGAVATAPTADPVVEIRIRRGVYRLNHPKGTAVRISVTAEARAADRDLMYANAGDELSALELLVENLETRAKQQREELVRLLNTPGVAT